MAKICPYSMASEPAECYEEDCRAWNNGECSRFESEQLSMYFTAKNLLNIYDELKRIREGKDGRKTGNRNQAAY